MTSQNKAEGFGADRPAFFLPHSFVRGNEAAPAYCAVCGNHQNNPRHAEVGDVVAAWFDTGAMGATLVYARVTKRSERMLQVRGERGTKLVWKRPHYFNHIARGSELAEIAPLFSSEGRPNG